MRLGGIKHTLAIMLLIFFAAIVLGSSGNAQVRFNSIKITDIGLFDFASFWFIGVEALVTKGKSCGIGPNQKCRLFRGYF